MSIFCNIYLVVKINNWYCRKFQEKFQLTTPYWSMISSLLHLVGLRPRVYYTLINFRGGGAKAPLAPPSIRQWFSRKPVQLMDNESVEGMMRDKSRTGQKWNWREVGQDGSETGRKYYGTEVKRVCCGMGMNRV